MACKLSHLGVLIRNAILPETGLTINELAKRYGLVRNTMSKVVNGRGDVSEDAAICLSCVLGSSSRF